MEAAGSGEAQGPTGRGECGPGGDDVVDHQHGPTIELAEGAEPRHPGPFGGVQAGERTTPAGFEQRPDRKTQPPGHPAGQQLAVIEAPGSPTSDGGRSPRDEVDGALVDETGHALGQPVEGATLVAVLDPGDEVPGGTPELEQGLTGPETPRRRHEPAAAQVTHAVRAGRRPEGTAAAAPGFEEHGGSLRRGTDNPVEPTVPDPCPRTVTHRPRPSHSGRPGTGPSVDSVTSRPEPRCSMQVDVWSDVVCPWCFVGLANLDAALADFEHADEIEVVLHSFQLEPDAPPVDDRAYEEILAAKYGQPVEQIRAMQQRLVDLGAERDIDFRFDTLRRANTFNAHRLLHLAARHGRSMELKKRLGRAYFTDGELVSDHDTLERLAVEVGLDADEVRRVLDGDEFGDEVRRDLASAGRIGVSGVPFFVVDGRLGLSGAQPAEVLGRVLDQAWSEREPQIVTVAGEGDDDAACGPDGCEIPT